MRAENFSANFVTLSTSQSMKRHISEDGRLTQLMVLWIQRREVAVVWSGPLACVILPDSWQFLGAFAKLRKATISFVMSVRLSDCRSASKNSVPTERIFMKIHMNVFFGKCFENIQVSLKSDKHNGYFAWRLIYIFGHLSLISPYNEKILRRTCRENQNIQ